MFDTFRLRVDSGRILNLGDHRCNHAVVSSNGGGYPFLCGLQPDGSDPTVAFAIANGFRPIEPLSLFEIANTNEIWAAY